MEINSCNNCNEPVTGNYCSHCGHPEKPKRIDRHFIVRQIASVFNAERGTLYTIKRLLINPGDSIKQYITEDRSKYAKPVTFLIITSLIYTLVHHFLHIDIKDYTQPQQSEIDSPTANLLMNWMIDYHGYSSLISGFLMAFGIKLFYRKSVYNLFEIFVLLCYISGMGSLIFSVVFIVQELMHLHLINIAILIALAYYTWAIGQFFDRKNPKSYIKAFLSYAFGIFIFTIIFAIVIIFIDVIINPQPI
jgi:hypothetical protein